MLKVRLWSRWEVRAGKVVGNVALWLVLGWVEVAWVWQVSRSGVGDVALWLVLGRVEIAWIWNIVLASSDLGLSHQFLSLSRVLADGALDNLGSVASMLGCEVAELTSLLVDDVAGVVEVVVDKLLVLDVKQRSEEEDGGKYESDSPRWSEFDEEVGEESRGKCQRMSENPCAA